MRPGTDVWIKKNIFAKNIGEKIGVFFAQTIAIFCDNLIITLCSV
jgi:hypothetical protein